MDRAILFIRESKRPLPTHGRHWFLGWNCTDVVCQIQFPAYSENIRIVHTVVIFFGILGVEEKLTVLHNKFAFLGAIGVLAAIQKMLHLFGVRFDLSFVVPCGVLHRNLKIRV